ncbi:MAG: endoribonuclease MazF [Tagaea sp.]
MSRAFVPEAGDVVWLQFDPQAGHEQAGHRPALVLSPARYNAARGMMVCCPMTSKIKGYPFEVVVSNEPASVILADQVKNLDWRARKAARKGNVPPSVLAEVRGKLKALLEL